MGLGNAMGMGAAVAAAVVAAVPLLVPTAAEMVGFGAHGIVAGSWAAAWMRSYGGHVPAGSLCALLQRVGSQGRLESSSVVVAEGAAVALAGLSAFFLRRAKELGNVDAAEPAHYELIVEEEAAESARLSMEEEEEDDGPMISVLVTSPPVMELEPAPSAASPTSHVDPSMLLNPFAHLQEPSSSTTCSCTSSLLQ